MLIFDRFHRREQEHIPDGCAVGQQHGEPVDAVADAAGGGHADLHGVEEVLIGVLGLFVALLGEGVLGGEALALVDGVVELGVGVAHLPAVDVELEALDLGRVAGLFLGQRADLDGMVHDEGGLDHLVLAELVEEEVDDVALLVAVLIFDVALVGQLLGLFVGGDLVEVDAGLFLDGVDHGQAAEGLAEVDLGAVVGDGGGAADLLGQEAVHVLGQVHHAVVVGVGLVELHEGELGIVAGVKTLVAEDAADLIDPLESADDEALEVELQGNAELEVLVQGVEVGLEGAGRSAAGVGDQHGGLDLHEVAVREEAADACDDLRAFHEDFAGGVTHDEVDVALAIAHVGVLEAVEFLRQGGQGLGQESELLGVDGDLAGLGLEDKALDADDVADVHSLEALVGFLADLVAGDVDLDAAVSVLDVAEGGLAHDALEHHAACDGDVLVLELVEVLFDLLTVVGLVIFDDQERVVSGSLQLCQLVAADFLQLRDVLRLLLVVLLIFLLILLCHVQCSSGT